MQTNPFNNTQSLTNDPTLSTRFVRTGGASDARGFAQVMQAFGSDSDASAAQQIADRQDADEAEAKNQSSDESDSTSADSSAADESGSASEANEQGASDPQSDADGSAKTDRPAEQSSDTPMDEQADDAAAELALAHQPGTPGALAGEQAIQAQEVSMRLLNNQSEQAKLSIKSLVRSLTHASSADATTIAVDTRLGRIEHPGAGAEPRQVAPDQSKADQPIPPRAAFSLQDGAGSNRNQPATDASGVQPGVIRFDPTPPIPSTTPISLSDQGSQQTGQQTGQQVGQRVDAAGVVAQTLSGALPTPPARGSANQHAGQVSGITTGQSQQAIRAVASIDPSQGGQVGNQQPDSNPGSLVERMKPSQMPSETKRAEVLAQVQRGLASLLRSGKGEMTLKLTPGHLGEVRIRINANTGSGLGIRFETSSDQATELLTRSIKELSVNLQSKGIKLDQIQVENTLSPNTPNPDSATRLGGDASQDHAGHPGEDQPQHRDRAQRFDAEPDDEHQHEQPDSIWTDLGLDAIA